MIALCIGSSGHVRSWSFTAELQIILEHFVMMYGRTLVLVCLDLADLHGPASEGVVDVVCIVVEVGDVWLVEMLVHVDLRLHRVALVGTIHALVGPVDVREGIAHLAVIGGQVGLRIVPIRLLEEVLF